MPLYESTFIARQDISSQEVENLTQQFSQIIKDNGGNVVKHEYWGLRTLAYAVKKNRKGHYVMLVIDAPSDAVKEMERNMGIHDDILRNVSVRLESITEGPSFMISNRDEGGRPARPGSYQPRGRRDDAAKPDSTGATAA